MQDHDPPTGASMLRPRAASAVVPATRAAAPLAAASTAVPVAVAGGESLSLRGPARTRTEGLPA